jgi:Tol biopolymer transport system component
VNPATGEVLITQSVCSSDADAGFFLYPANGGTGKRLTGENGFTFALETPRWSADGSVFVFSGRDGAQVQSLYAFSMSTQKVVQLVPGDATRSIRTGAVSADGNAIVYCVREGQADNLHVVDVSVDPPVDTAITNDGASCNPVFF